MRLVIQDTEGRLLRSITRFAWELPPLAHDDVADLEASILEITGGLLKVDRVDQDVDTIYVSSTSKNAVVTTDWRKRQLLKTIEQWVADVNYSRLSFENSFPHG